MFPSFFTEPPFPPPRRCLFLIFTLFLFLFTPFSTTTLRCCWLFPPLIDVLRRLSAVFFLYHNVLTFVLMMPFPDVLIAHTRFSCLLSLSNLPPPFHPFFSVGLAQRPQGWPQRLRSSHAPVAVVILYRHLHAAVACHHRQLPRLPLAGCPRDCGAPSAIRGTSERCVEVPWVTLLLLSRYLFFKFSKGRTK